MALHPCGPWPLFQFLNLYTVGRTPWTGDQPVARPLPTHRSTQTQNKRHTDILASSGIRTHDPSVRASEDGSCLRPRGHCARQPNCSASSELVINTISGTYLVQEINSIIAVMCYPRDVLDWHFHVSW
jgi:hypothetical protein